MVFLAVLQVSDGRLSVVVMDDGLRFFSFSPVLYLDAVCPTDVFPDKYYLPVVSFVAVTVTLDRVPVPEPAWLPWLTDVTTDVQRTFIFWCLS